MKNIFVIAILLLTTMTSCSDTIEPGVFEIGVWEQQNINTMSFVIDIETTPFTYDEDFYIELVMFAKPIICLASEECWLESLDEPIYVKSVVLTCDDFILCNGKLVYRLGHQFTEDFESADYFLDYDVATEQDYIVKNGSIDRH